MKRMLQKKLNKEIRFLNVKRMGKKFKQKEGKFEQQFPV